MNLKVRFRSQIKSLILATIFAIVAFILSFSNVLLPVEHLAYDRLLRTQLDSYSSEVIIVAIDEKSLQKYGPLPWSRQLHIDLINKLTNHNVRAIGYDILFNKKNNQNDDLLVKAVSNNGNVIFPVVIERVTQTGELIELMPFPELTQVAVNLGLVHFELSDDNIARSSYLKAGLGEPYWRSFSAEVLEIANGDKDLALQIGESGKTPSYDLTKIEQEGLIYIPYKQNSNHFKRISFVDVVEETGNVPNLNDKVIFVGVTATAARNADFLPVPVDRNGQIMPGVEINATLYESLEEETYITILSDFWSALFSAVVIFIFFNLLPKSLPKRSFFYGIIFIIILILTSWWLLHIQHFWVKMATPIIAIMIGYLVWIWQKMVANMTFFKTTVERLSVEMENSMDLNNPATMATKLKFLSHINLVENSLLENFEINKKWSQDELIDELGKLERIDATSKEKKLFQKLIKASSAENRPLERQSYGVIEERIKSFESAIRKINFLRRFIEQTMDRMSDGIILSDIDGQIFYSNLIAKRYIPQLRKKNSLIQLFELMPLQDNLQWDSEISKVLQDGLSKELMATTQSGLDLKLSVSLLDNVSGRDFITINIVDISAIKREQRRQLEMIDFISHDLRSPMTSTLALLSRYNREPEKYDSKEMHIEIEKLTRSSLNLAEQFLVLSRAESNLDLAIYPIELLSSIDNAIAIVMPQSASAKVNLNFDFMAYEDIWINANQDLLERIFTNLLSNAIKYSPPGSQVDIEIRQTRDVLQVLVLDQGDGISQEQMDTIFKSFTRMQKHEMAKIKGIGLGLRFVKSVMMRFAGTVSVESVVGKGSCFTLEFPSRILANEDE